MDRRIYLHMNKRKARVLRINKSLAVVLPKDWTRGMEVEAGDEVEIVYDGQVSIRAKPPEGEPDA